MRRAAPVPAIAVSRTMSKAGAGDGGGWWVQAFGPEREWKPIRVAAQMRFRSTGSAIIRPTAWLASEPGPGGPDASNVATGVAPDHVTRRTPTPKYSLSLL